MQFTKVVMKEKRQAAATIAGVLLDQSHEPLPLCNKLLLKSVPPTIRNETFKHSKESKIVELYGLERPDWMC